MKQWCEARRGRVKDIKWWNLPQSLLQRANCVCAAATRPMDDLCHIIVVTSFSQLTNASRFRSFFNTIHSNYPTTGWGFLDLSNPRRCVVHHVYSPPMIRATGLPQPTLATGFSTPSSMHGPRQRLPMDQHVRCIHSLLTVIVHVPPGIESGRLE
jgi:hypothetical protein